MVADVYFCFFCVFCNGFAKVFTTFLGKRRKNKSDADTVVLRGNTNIGSIDCFFDSFKARFIPGLNNKNSCFRNGYSSTTGSSTSATRATSRFVQKNNTLTLSSASVYYEFPYSVMKKMKMNRLRLSLYANDLYTFSTIRIERGTSYPYARSFSFSVTATF